MRTLVALALAALLAMPAFGQYEKLPQLEEWFSMSGGGPGINYLPNFDVANNGINATAVEFAGNPTWYNRFPGDTANQFRWYGADGSAIVDRVDINGDGIIDYVDFNGYIYVGKAKDSPPVLSGKIKGLFERYSYQSLVGDFTGDGIGDVISRGKPAPDSTEQDGYLVIGNADTSRIRSLSFKFPGIRRDIMLAAYTSTGKGRVISYGYDNEHEGFYLWSVEVETTGEPTVKLTLLDKVERFKLPGSELFYRYYNSGLYLDPKKQETAFIAAHGSTDIYNLVNDKLVFVYEQKLIQASYFLLPTGIDYSSKSAYLRTSVNGILFYRGNPSEDTIPVARFPGRMCGERVLVNAVSIGDVTGDGVGDVALSYSSNGYCFIIAKGLSPLSVEQENSLLSFFVGQSNPSPVSMSGQGVVTASIEKAGRYALTLYSLNGNEVARVFAGELSPGEHRFVIEPKRFGLAPGLYNLRLTDGVRTRERGFLVEGR